MDRGSCASARAHLIRSARVVAIGEQNASDSIPGKLCQTVLGWLHRVNAEVSICVADEMSVEVVSVRLGKPRPGEDTGQYFFHFSSLGVSAVSQYNQA